MLMEWRLARMWCNDCGYLFPLQVSKNVYREDISLSNHQLFIDTRLTKSPPLLTITLLSITVNEAKQIQ